MVFFYLASEVAQWDNAEIDDIWKYRMYTYSTRNLRHAIYRKKLGNAQNKTGCMHPNWVWKQFFVEEHHLLIFKLLFNLFKQSLEVWTTINNFVFYLCVQILSMNCMQVLHNMFQGNPQSITVTSELNGQLINVSEIPLVFMKCDEFSKHLYVLAHLDHFMQLKCDIL